MNHANLAIDHAQVDPSRVAVQMGTRAVTYGQFVEASEMLALGLRRHGIGVGERVMLFADNTIESLIIYHAVARLGAVLAPVHVSFKIRELAYALSNAKPSLIITSSDLFETLKAGLNETSLTPAIVFLDNTPQVGYRHLSDLMAEPGSFPPIDLPPEQPLLISYTSGTTSLPKPVLRSHGAETWSAKAYRDAWTFERDDRLLVAMSLSWVFGLCSLSQSAFGAGATIVLETKFSPTRTLELIAAKEVTAFAGTMSMYAMMLQVLNQQAFDTSALRKTILGGEPRNEVVVAEMQTRLGLRLCEAWAMTESFPALAIHPVHDVDAPPTSLGRCVPGVEIKLVDADGWDVAVDEPGEAWIRGPGDFLAYADEPDLTASRRTADGWLRSGDILKRDALGYYTFVTRQSEIIIRGGVNISPAEVESAICAHPDVLDAVVIGLPDSVLGETVAALVIVRNDYSLDTEKVLEFLADRIARFKIPTNLFQVTAMPAGTTGKKNRVEARRIAIALHAQALQVQVELPRA
ncbi:long-chain fatty acid--CoA ligase [Paraburkholderia dipogonis]|uniref:Long-chain fatty acid--CoA ligase n=1 Tax=Paraburkholderia dipogonis TaxID=1211383 RepID=A0A4Y8MGW5_9BURK|nr:class I adenylate-forming enzyme family protein [Paraburkholderia dipogonis]TFE36726.1 long-chain fatty acid--CoA ligase [Paraburkholderia dipogonis]